MAQPENHPMSPLSSKPDDQPDASQALPPITSQPVDYPQGPYPAGATADHLALPPPPQYAPPGYPQPMQGQVVPSYTQSLPGQAAYRFPLPPPQPPLLLAPPPSHSDPSLPPGLEYINMVDGLFVTQTIEIILTGSVTAKYVVVNSMGQLVYNVVMVSIYDIVVLDNHRTEIMRIRQPKNGCCACTCCCCCYWGMPEMQVTSGNGQVLLGTVQQNWSFGAPKFSVNNATGEAVLHIRGPVWVTYTSLDVECDVLSLDGQHKIGYIAKKGSGMLGETYNEATKCTFGLTFPMDLDVNTKATLFAATFLMEMLFFAQSGQRYTTVI